MNSFTKDFGQKQNSQIKKGRTPNLGEYLKGALTET